MHVPPKLLWGIDSQGLDTVLVVKKSVPSDNERLRELEMFGNGKEIFSKSF